MTAAVGFLAAVTYVGALWFDPWLTFAMGVAILIGWPDPSEE